MSYQFSENAYSRLHQARDALRLLKHSSQEASTGATLDCGLLGSYLTLIDGKRLGKSTSELQH
jgi:hypothetical protein